MGLGQRVNRRGHKDKERYGMLCGWKYFFLGSPTNDQLNHFFLKHVTSIALRSLSIYFYRFISIFYSIFNNNIYHNVFCVVH